MDGKKKRMRENLAQDIPCSVSVSPVQDNRANQQTLGRQFKKSLIPEGFEEWLAEAFNDIEKLGVTEQPDKTQVLRVEPSLLKLYASAKILNLHDTVSMKFDYFAGGQKIETALLRGDSTTLNWAGGDGEYVDVLNKATQDMFPKFAKTTADVCKTL